MNSNPFNLLLVIDRLKPLMPKPVSVIGSVIEYNKITDLSGFTTPALYVVPASEVGKPNQGVGHQRADVIFGVIVVVQNYQYSNISPMLHEKDPLIGLVRDQLMGWVPDVPGGRGVEWLRGDVLDYNSSALVWLETYQTAQFIRGKNA